ncbi:hypothetical protein [Sphingobium yanoikuyae]|uniref:hypothetical protein n=1 Tax=Sphingobium yanoikuyae TaxID=13690 RepID=UPI003EFCAFE7
MTDSGDFVIFKSMKGQRKVPWIPHGSESRFIEKSIRGMQKDNEREASIGSLTNIKREMRARLHIERPGASSAEIEASIERQCSRGMKPYQPLGFFAQAAPEENLVSEKDQAERQRKKGRRSTKR